MMPMTRTEEPDFLRAHRQTWTQRWIDRRSSDPSAGFDWPQLGGRGVNRLLLDVLVPLTCNHCAYCDHAPLAAGSRQTIDHFRPKGDSRFLAFAFVWDNLFPCCDVCQQNKGGQWEEGLLKPDSDGYSFSRYFSFNPFDGALLPNPFASEADRDRSATTIQVFGLNHEVRRQARKNTLKRLLQGRRDGATPDAGESYRFLFRDLGL